MVKPGKYNIVPWLNHHQLQIGIDTDNAESTVLIVDYAEPSVFISFRLRILTERL